MKIKGTPGTIKIGEIEVATVESLEMKTPGFKIGPHEWDGSFCGEFTRPEPGPVSVVFKLGWRRLWRRYYCECDIDDIDCNIDGITGNVITTAEFKGEGERITDNIFGRIWATIKGGLKYDLSKTCKF